MLLKVFTETKAAPKVFERFSFIPRGTALTFLLHICRVKKGIL